MNKIRSIMSSVSGTAFDTVAEAYNRDADEHDE